MSKPQSTVKTNHAQILRSVIGDDRMEYLNMLSAEVYPAVIEVLEDVARVDSECTSSTYEPAVEANFIAHSTFVPAFRAIAMFLTNFAKNKDEAERLQNLLVISATDPECAYSSKEFAKRARRKARAVESALFCTVNCALKDPNNANDWNCESRYPCYALELLWLFLDINRDYGASVVADCAQILKSHLSAANLTISPASRPKSVGSATQEVCHV